MARSAGQDPPTEPISEEPTVTIPRAGEATHVLREVDAELVGINEDLLARVLAGLRNLDTGTRGRHAR